MCAKQETFASTSRCCRYVELRLCLKLSKMGSMICCSQMIIGSSYLVVKMSSMLQMPYTTASVLVPNFDICTGIAFTVNKVDKYSWTAVCRC